MFGPLELGLILLLVLMLFGAGQIPKVMRQLGRGMRELSRATTLDDDK